MCAIDCSTFLVLIFFLTNMYFYFTYILYIMNNKVICVYAYNSQNCIESTHRSSIGLLLEIIYICTANNAQLT